MLDICAHLRRGFCLTAQLFVELREFQIDLRVI